MFVNTGFSTGFLNMVCDERTALELPASGYEGILRVYGWKPPCISLGFHQSLDAVNLERCRSEGIDVVRRPTGGRAIFHCEEVTYSVVMSAEGSSFSDVYYRIGRALERALQSFHKDIKLSRPRLQADSRLLPSSRLPCYASIARFELQYQGKKIVGSAQRRYRLPVPSKEGSKKGGCEVILQHGSILLGPAHRRLVNFLDVSEEQAESLRKELEIKSTELSSILHRSVQFEEVAENLKRGFEEAWGIQFSSSPSAGSHAPTSLARLTNTIGAG